MFVVIFLFIAIVLLMVLVGVAYRSESDEPPVESERRLDRVAAILDPGVMEGVIRQAQIEGRPESEVLNRMVRIGLDTLPQD